MSGQRLVSNLRGLGGAGVLALAVATIGLMGCQAEHAGMTLPSHRYLLDDVQSFDPGPGIPYPNTQANIQRSAMQAQGIPIPDVAGAGFDAQPQPPAGGQFPDPNNLDAPIPGLGLNQNDRPAMGWGGGL